MNYFHMTLEMMNCSSFHLVA